MIICQRYQLEITRVSKFEILTIVIVIVIVIVMSIASLTATSLFLNLFS